jgi:hypothetical protein
MPTVTKKFAYEKLGKIFIVKFIYYSIYFLIGDIFNNFFEQLMLN